MFKANRLVCHSTLSLRMIKKKKLSENLQPDICRCVFSFSPREPHTLNPK